MALKANYFFILLISIEASVWIASALEGTPDAGVAMISTLSSTKGLDHTASDKSFDTSSFVQQTSQLELPEPHTITYRTHDQNIPKNNPVLASDTASSMLFAQSGPTDGISTQKRRRDPSDQKNNNSISTDSESSSSAFPKWIIGLGLAVLACAFNALGFVFQRRGHQSTENKCPWLVGGLLMLAAGGLLDFASLGFAAQSLVAATGGLTLVCNVIFAKTVLHEPVSTRVLIGTLIVLGGCGITVAFSSHHSDARTGEELADLLKEPKAIIYFIISDGLILLSVGAIILMESLYFTPEHRTGCLHTFCNSKQSTAEELTPREPSGLAIEIAVTPSSSEAGSGMGCPGNIPEHAVEPKSAKDDGAEVTDGLQDDGPQKDGPQKDGLVRPWTEGMADDPRVVNLHGVLHSWVSGIAGSQSVLFGKICAEILVNAADEAEFHYYVFFCSAVGMGLFVWLQLYSMNRGLKYHQTVLIVPAYQTFWTLGGIACGAAIFDEFAGASVLSLIAYPLGMMVMLGGVWMLIVSQQSSQMGHEALTNDTSANEDIRTLPYNPNGAV